MTIDWSLVLWASAAFLAASTLVKMCQARRQSLRGKLNSWLTTELESNNKRKKLAASVRRKRAELAAKKEAQDADAAAEIAELNITGLMGEEPS